MARRLLHLLRPGMLVLLDRGFDSNQLFAQITGTGAMLLCRARSTRNPVVVGVLPDGSYLSDLNGLAVRVIEAEMTMTGADGSRVGDGYRLITTLLDHHRFPAPILIRLYHERWEIEVAYLALRHTLLDGHVLRSGDRPGLEQEMWALLTVYQLLRMVMVTAVETCPGVNPDRASFTTALETAREQLTAARLPADPADLRGVIGTAVLETLLPERRPRYSARTVKSSHHRYAARGEDPRPTTSTMVTTIDITVHAPVPKPNHPKPSRPSCRPTTPGLPVPGTRRHRIVEIMSTDPRRAWPGSELAKLMQVKPRNMLTQLAEWSRLGFLARTDEGTYQLTEAPSSTQRIPA